MNQSDVSRETSTAGSKVSGFNTSSAKVANRPGLDLVIFDADGVLFDSTESNVAYYNAIFELVGQSRLSAAEEGACVFMSAPQVFALRAQEEIELIERMRAAARTIELKRFFNLLRPYPALRGFLLELKQEYRLGLATNRSATMPTILDYLGLEDVFDAVASARDPVRPKPAPDILQLCLERAAVQPHRAVYVGDSETDRIAAESAGTHFIGVGERAPHVHQIQSLAELPEKLRETFGR